jgi:DNA helicase-2/ATP-dependent DNA helicase PcrA
MEEERRLAYVAITRAKDLLYIIHTSHRMLYGRTSYNPISRFVDEIPERLIDKQDKPKATRFADSGYYSQANVRKAPAFGDEKLTVNKPLFTPQAQSSNKITFKEGDIVTHMTFGRGEVLSVKPMGADTLYEVAFDKVGTKKLMGTYARLKKG